MWLLLCAGADSSLKSVQVLVVVEKCQGRRRRRRRRRKRRRKQLLWLHESTAADVSGGSTRSDEQQSTSCFVIRHNKQVPVSFSVTWNVELSIQPYFFDRIYFLKIFGLFLFFQNLKTQ